MTDSLMVSLLSDGDLDAVTGGTILLRAARNSVSIMVSQTAQGGFVGDFTVSNTFATKLTDIGNTSNSVTTITTAVA